MVTIFNNNTYINIIRALINISYIIFVFINKVYVISLKLYYKKLFKLYIFYLTNKKKTNDVTYYVKIIIKINVYIKNFTFLIITFNNNIFIILNLL